MSRCILCDEHIAKDDSCFCQPSDFRDRLLRITAGWETDRQRLVKLRGQRNEANAKLTDFEIDLAAAKKYLTRLVDMHEYPNRYKAEDVYDVVAEAREWLEE